MLALLAAIATQASKITLQSYTLQEMNLQSRNRFVFSDFGEEDDPLRDARVSFDLSILPKMYKERYPDDEKQIRLYVMVADVENARLIGQKVMAEAEKIEEKGLPLYLGEFKNLLPVFEVVELSSFQEDPALLNVSSKI